MKFLMTYAAKPGSAPPDAAKMAAINEYSTRMIDTGIIVLTGGLVRPTKGTQLRCDGGRVSVIDGPFAESKKLIDGFALVEVGSKDEAVAVASAFMQVAGDGDGEILQVFEGGGKLAG